MRYTIFGGTGFIGSHFVSNLKDVAQVYIPPRKGADWREEDLGIVLYCAGHGDCAGKPGEVFDANTRLLWDVLDNGKFDRLLYLSSTRLYLNSSSSDEDSPLTIYPSDARRLFNISKLHAEELCLRCGKDIVIVRPSNVYGMALDSPLYLPSITRDAINRGKIEMYVPKDYSKDYVSVHDLVDAVLELSVIGAPKHRIYNVASGFNMSAEQVGDILQAETNCDVVWHQSKYTESFPKISIERISREIRYEPRSLKDDLAYMVSQFKTALGR